MASQISPGKIKIMEKNVLQQVRSHTISQSVGISCVTRADAKLFPTVCDLDLGGKNFLQQIWSHIKFLNAKIVSLTRAVLVTKHFPI